jgi:hypothetical protein
MYASYSFGSRFFRRFGWKIESIGILFSYKGDEVIWIFPWKRLEKNRKFLSISFEYAFRNLQELDDMWDAYSEANQP